MVVASISLLVALGGTSVAAVNQLAANSVGTSQLKNNAVTTPKIKNSAVNASKIASNAVVAAKIKSNAVVAGEDRRQRRQLVEDRKRDDPAGRPLGGCQDLWPAGRAGRPGADRADRAGGAEQRVRAVRQRPNCHSRHTDHAHEPVHTGSGLLRSLGQGGDRDAGDGLRHHCLVHARSGC